MTKALKKTLCQELIEQEIRRFGPMPFDRFVELALYHPQYGYYSGETPRQGRSGDYYTSVQVSPLTAQIFTDVLVEMKGILGTQHFSLIEMGAGDGALLEGILDTLRKERASKGWQVFAVERSRSMRGKIWRRLSRFPRVHVVESLEDIDGVGGVEGCIFSNEFFDALPFHRLSYTPVGFQEIQVALREGAFTEETVPFARPLSGPNRMTGLSFEEGQQIEVRPGITDIYAEWSRLFLRGYVVTFDYGHPRAQLIDPRRFKGTWLCYSEHSANQEPYARIGEQDITAHVDFTQLSEEGMTRGFHPSLFCSQGVFLSHAGRRRIEAWLKKSKNTGALKQLLHPDALGEVFWTLIQTRNADLPEGLRGVPNRIRRLL